MYVCRDHIYFCSRHAGLRWVTYVCYIIPMISVSIFLNLQANIVVMTFSKAEDCLLGRTDKWQVIIGLTFNSAQTGLAFSRSPTWLCSKMPGVSEYPDPKKHLNKS